MTGQHRPQVIEQPGHRWLVRCTCGQLHRMALNRAQADAIAQRHRRTARPGIR